MSAKLINDSEMSSGPHQAYFPPLLAKELENYMQLVIPYPTAVSECRLRAGAARPPPHCGIRMQIEGRCSEAPTPLRYPNAD